MDECVIQGCTRTRKYVASGWCQTHYHRYWRTGSLDLLPKEQRADLTYFGAHGRVKALFGSARAQSCVSCDAPAKEWAYDGTDPTELSGTVGAGYPVTYSVWPEFYMPLCFPCHRAKDAGARYEKRTHFGCGHPRSPENTYTPPSRARCPECKLCRKIRSQASYARKST